MISTINFEHGDTTCAIQAGVFCRWVGSKSFGQKAICVLFEQELYENKPYGWLQRCDKCKKQFGVTEPEKQNVNNIQLVVDHVLHMARKYKFTSDLSNVSDSVESSSNMLNINLKPEEYTEACLQVLDLFNSKGNHENN